MVLPLDLGTWLLGALALCREGVLAIGASDFVVGWVPFDPFPLLRNTEDAGGRGWADQDHQGGRRAGGPVTTMVAGTIQVCRPAGEAGRIRNWREFLNSTRHSCSVFQDWVGLTANSPSSCRSNGF